MRSTSAALLLILSATAARAGTPLENLQKQAAHTPPRAAPDSALLQQAFVDFCLNRFPDQAGVSKAIGDQHLAKATLAEREQVTLGAEGDAWSIPVPKGFLVLTFLPPPAHGCSVAGVVQSSGAINSNFDTLVSGYAANHDLGKLVRIQPHYGRVAGKIATAQLLNVTAVGGARQAFANVDVLSPDTTTLVRWSRTVTPAAGK